MNKIEKNNDLENVTGGSEPPQYLSPEGEARAQALKRIMQRQMDAGYYREAIADSGLLVVDEEKMKEIIKMDNRNKAR